MACPPVSFSMLMEWATRNGRTGTSKPVSRLCSIKGIKSCRQLTFIPEDTEDKAVERDMELYVEEYCGLMFNLEEEEEE
jgi:hypothetical protein